MSDSTDTGKRRWSRRATVIGVSLIVVAMMAATAAFAAWLTVRETTPQSLTAAATGLDIGDVEGAELFSAAEVAAMAPGDEAVACFIGVYAGSNLDMQTAFYAVGRSGDAELLDYMDVRVFRETLVSGTAGTRTCGVEIPLAGTPVGGADFHLSDLTEDFTSAVAAGHYALPGPGVASGSGAPMYVGYKVILTLRADAPASIAGKSVTTGFAFAAEEIAP